MRRQNLLGLVLMASSLFSTPLHAAPAPAQVFLDSLNQQLEPLLQKRLGRSKVGFSAEIKGAAPNWRIVLPARLQRETVLDLQLRLVNGQPQLSGRQLTDAERDAVAAAAQKAWGKAPVLKVDTFPFDNLDPDYAITKVAASDLYVEPRAEAGDNLATQVRLGTPLEVLEHSADKRFARVRIVDDGYIAWIKRSDLAEVQAAAYGDWLKQRNLLVMKTQTQPLLYFGTRLRQLKQSGEQVQALTPDGKTVTLPASDVRTVAPSAPLPSAETILTTARQYLPEGPQASGPYLWGGTYGNRLDCSGFVQTVYRVNHVYLPRDADQQMNFTRSVGKTLAQLDELQPGDLVFFSGNRSYPTHVGLYLGNGQMIHSSPKGAYSGIKINTLRGGGEYDRYLQGIYFGGGRVTRSL
ncbi:MAG: NlpC/P60 family protein [Candidatus Sericytochromatia bacterium]